MRTESVFRESTSSRDRAEAAQMLARITLPIIEAKVERLRAIAYGRRTKTREDGPKASAARGNSWPSATPDPERTARCLKRLRALAERVLAREAREAREKEGTQNDAA